jgi:hypothetical protein
LSRSSDEQPYDATKRKYAEMFAVMEGYRWSLKGLRDCLAPDDADRIESEVRERIRKQRERDRARGDALSQEWEKEGKG